MDDFSEQTDTGQSTITKSGAGDRVYRVLVLSVGDKEEKTWIDTDGGAVEASSADEAIRKVAGRLGDGSYVAVPTRSWNPREVTTETTTKVSFA